MLDIVLNLNPLTIDALARDVLYSHLLSRASAEMHPMLDALVAEVISADRALRAPTVARAMNLFRRYNVEREDTFYGTPMYAAPEQIPPAWQDAAEDFRRDSSLDNAA